MSARDFSLLDELHGGQNLVEASAGTGKTYSIATLVLRLVAEQGLQIDEILVVTFTRAATAELRARIRARLQEGLLALSQPPDEVKDATLAALLRPLSPKMRVLFRSRLTRALMRIDAATIFTIHSFAQYALRLYALDADAEFTFEVEPNPQEVAATVTSDYLARRYFDASERDFRTLHDGCDLGQVRAQWFATRAISAPQAQLVPVPEYSGTILAKWHTQIDELRAAWSEQGDDVRAAIEDLVGLNTLGAALKKNIYKASGCAALFANFERWLFEHGTPMARVPKRGKKLLADVSWFKSLTPAKLLSSTTAAGLERVEAALARLPVLKQLKKTAEASARVVGNERAVLAARARAEFAEHLAERGTCTFDHLIARLRDALLCEVSRFGTQPETVSRSERLRASLRRRFGAALIDEFQDTDALQWDIFSALFADEERFLFLIGDPKQAIYSFRGADLSVYLRAREGVPQPRRTTISCNHRSDAALLTAMNTLWSTESPFLTDAVSYVPVRARVRDVDRRLRSSQVQQATHFDPRSAIRLFIHDGDSKAAKGAKDTMPRQVAADIAAVLNSGVELYDDQSASWRRVSPSDCAVLLRSNTVARDYRAALNDLGVSAALVGAGESVLSSPQLQWIDWWLFVIDRPPSQPALGGLLASELFGCTADDLRVFGEQCWDRLFFLAGRWRRLYHRWGFYRSFRALLTDRLPAAINTTGETCEITLSELILSRQGGERSLTNLFHLAEILHAGPASQHPTPGGLRTFIRRDADSYTTEDETEQLRLETDSKAVTISTIHRAKGLEYSLVWIPDMYNNMLVDSYSYAAFCGRTSDGQLILDLRPDNDATPKRDLIAGSQLSASQEAMRVLYVAMTRARCLCTAFWLPSPKNVNRFDPLGHLLSNGDPETMDESLDRLAANSRGTIAVLPFGGGGPATIPAIDSKTQARELHTAQFSRQTPSNKWAQHSFSSISGTPAAPRMALASEGVSPLASEHNADYDQNDTTPSDTSLIEYPKSTTPENEPELPLGRFPGGTQVGLFIHRLYELADFRWGNSNDHSDAATSAHQLVQDCARAFGLDEAVWNEEFTSAWLSTLATPLGGPLGASRLCDIEPRHRLDEWSFDLSLAGGFTPSGDGVKLPALFNAMEMTSKSGHGDDSHATQGAGRSMITEYLKSLGSRFDSAGELQGFCSGIVDLAFFATCRDGQRRFFIADYKSNILNPHSNGNPTASHYCMRGLAAPMSSHHYYLQYHLYTVALCRFLRSRLGDGFNYERDFGGVYYLFVRGMNGPDTLGAGDASAGGEVGGVFFHRPAAVAIKTISELFCDPTDSDAIAIASSPFAHLYLDNQ